MAPHPPARSLLWKALVPTVGLIGFSVWALVERNLVAFQAVASVPFLYMLVFSVAGAIAYRPRPRPDEAPIPDEALPSVSVLIPAHNEENVIANTLRHVLRIDYPRLEVIVVDDASVDRTADIVRTFPVTLVRRRDPLRRGKSEALNAGLGVARGDVICVFDADSEMAPDFLRQAVVPLVADPEVCGVQGQVRMYNRGRNVLTRAQEDEFAIHNEVLQLGRERLGGACALGGNGQLTRRDALEAVGGWNASSLTEDLDLTVRLLLAGCGRVSHRTSAVVWQEGVPSLGALLRQRTRWAEGILRCWGEYTGPVLASRRMPLRLRVDTFCALFSVFFPIFSVASLVFSVLNAVPHFFVHALPAELGLAFMAFVLGAMCLWSNAVSYRRDRRLTLMPVVRYVVYILHWVPAFACALRNVVRDQPVVWQKTEHGRERERARSGEPSRRPSPALRTLEGPSPGS